METTRLDCYYDGCANTHVGTRNPLISCVPSVYLMLETNWYHRYERDVNPVHESTSLGGPFRLDLTRNGDSGDIVEDFIVRIIGSYTFPLNNERIKARLCNDVKRVIYGNYNAESIMVVIQIRVCKKSHVHYEDNYEEDDEEEEEIVAEVQRISMEDYGPEVSLGTSRDAINLLVSKIFWKQLDGNSKECVICMEEFIDWTRITEMPCFHAYHPECILTWLETNHTCPLCRSKMPIEEDTVPITT